MSGYVRLIGLIAIVEEPTSNQGDAECSEVVRRRRAVVRRAGPVLLFPKLTEIVGLRRRLSSRHDEEQPIGQTAVHGHGVHPGHLLDAGNGAEPIEEVRIERRETCFCGRIARIRKVEVHRDQALRAETRIHRQHAQQAATEERCADEEHHGDRQLCGNDRATDALTGRASLRTPAVGQRLARIPGCRSRGGDEPQRDRDEGRQRDGEAEHRPAQGHLFQPRKIGGRE